MGLSIKQAVSSCFTNQTLTLLGEGWTEYYFCTMNEELAKKMDDVNKTRKKRVDSIKILIYIHTYIKYRSLLSR